MSRKSALSVLSATLAALCLTSTARANPSASLTVTQTQTDGSPIPAGGVLNGTAVLVNVQYQLTDLPSDGAFIEFDICAPGQSIAGYPSGGEIEWGNQPACTLANGSGGVRVRSPHIGSSGSATQAVTGVYTIALATSGIIDGANTQWTVPVRVVIDSTARPTLYSSSFVILGTSAYSPLFSTSIFGVVAAPAPVGGAPGYNVSFHLQPTQWPWITGIAPMPHTTVTGTIPAGAQYVGYNIAPLSDITNYGPAFVAATFNDNRAFTLGSDGTTYSFSLDHLITFANNDTAVDLTLWFPKTAHTVAHTPVTAAFSNGATFNDDPTIVLGDAFTYGNKMHREWNGWWTTLAANSPNYGDNPTEYVSAGGLIEWWVYFGFTNENWGAAAGVNPALIDQIPPGEAVYDVYSVRDDNGSRDVSDLVDFSISTEPGCGPGPGTTWTPAGLHDSATLATARCLRVMYPGVYQTSVSMQYSARQTAAAEAQVLSSPAGYVFDDNYAYALLDNGAGVHAGNSTSVWAGDPTIAQITGRVTVQNAAQPMTWTYPAEWTFPYAKVGDDVYAGAGVPFHQDANAPAGFTDLTFSETLPLELDLRGPPTLAPGYAYPIGDDGQPMIPSCTWNAQDRSQLPIVPASFTCTFAGHYPAYREEPFTTPGCNATNEYCLNNWQTKDASGNYVLNEFVFQVPQHIISGYQGQQIVQRFSAWSTQPLDQNGNPRAGSSAATAYLSGPNENLLAINGVLQVGLTDVAQASVITAHSTVPFNLSYANSGSAAIANTRIYDLLGRDSTTGAPLAGCETPRFVSAVNQGGDPAPLIEYTTDAAPQPNDSSNWSATPPSDLSL
ncbi:MAG: hypothetical protein JST92_02900, partial [Deltaproteobacteria bacterium]|nr:hypothetical protein [Deltaproteobacteria bacterium]